MSGFREVSRGISILVVDDASTMRRIVKGCFKQFGFENITEAEDGKIALAKLQSPENHFDLIVSDWNMPNMMGIDLLIAVRADEKLKKIPFLMITAEARSDNVVAAAKAGVSNYIVKPFTVDQLEAKLELIYSKK